MGLRTLTLFAAIGFVLLGPGCKSTEENLQDLGRSLGAGWELEPTVYDAGQLVHESISGLLAAETLTSAQVGRGAYYAAQIVERTEVPLLRADAVNLLAHLAERYPLPPRSEPYKDEKLVNQVAREKASQLMQATDPLSIGRVHIPALENPDRVVVDEAVLELERLTGEKRGRSPDGWRSWWAENQSAIVTTALTDSEEPLKTLADLRYPNLSGARAILGLVTLTVNLYDVPELQARLDRATTLLARQVVEFGIAQALEDPDAAIVRVAGARGAAKVADLSFGPIIGRRLLRETDEDALGALIRASRSYPGKDTIRGLIRCLENDHAAVRIQAREVLVAMTETDQGAAIDGWALWWEREGEMRWP